MTEQPGPSQNPYGQPVPSGQDDPYGQQPTHQPYGSYGQGPYGGVPARSGDKRPGTVTAAAWIAIVFSGLTAALFALAGLGLLVARDDVIAEMEKVPEFQETNVDADAAVGVLVVVLLAVVIWCLISAVLAIFVLRRSNVARILLVISASVAGVLSLIGLAGGGVSIVPLIGCLATIILLFVGGAGAWFRQDPGHPGGYPGDPAGYQAGLYGQQAQQPGPYGGYGEQPQQQAPQQSPQQSDYPNPYGNPYGAPSQDQPGSATNPYGQVPPTHQDPDRPTGEDGQEYPPRDYPGR